MDMSKALDLLSNIMNRSDKNPMVLLAQLAYKLTPKPEKGSWIKLSDAILNDEIRVGSLMHSVFARYALKTVIHLWSLGKHKDVNSIADIAKYALRTGVYLEEGKLSPTSFHNLVVTMCQVLSEKEMIDFAKKWSVEVDDRYQLAAAKIAKAQIYFYFGKYHLILSNTNVIDLSSNQKYLAQGLDVIAAFENREKEPLFYQRQLQKFANFLMYNKEILSSNLYIKYRNMLKLLKDIEQKKSKLNIVDYSTVY